MRQLTEFFERVILTERYASLNSPIHHIDARVKLLVTLLMVTLAVSTSSTLTLAVLLLLLLTLLALSRLPLKPFTSTTLLLPSFTGIITLPLLFLVPGKPLLEGWVMGYGVSVTAEGLGRWGLLTVKVWVCIGSVTLLVMTTGFTRLVKAMEGLKLPWVFTMMVAVTYRYLHLLVEEAYRMALARESRSFSGEGRRRLITSLGGMLGHLFIRAYERGEEVHMAMLSRGYLQGRERRPPQALGRGDAVFALLAVSVCLTAVTVGFWVV